MSILVTGVAGFIGCDVALQLLAQGHNVVGIDNLNDYYEVQLKRDRLARIDSERFTFVEMGVEDREAMAGLAAEHQFDRIVHLAAQAGVRYSIENPNAYIDSNLVGFCNILELARQQQVAHLVYASSSSVYGHNEKQPFSEDDPVDHPVSLYAATKKANEVMAHSYSHLYGVPTTGLRFFTVYGPWGRPDMAPMKFLKLVSEGKPIDVYNQGDMQRDFTFIDDIVAGVLQSLDAPPARSAANKNHTPASSDAPYRVLNIGNAKPVHLMEFIETLERHWGRVAEKNYLPMQPGDVPITYADASKLTALTGYQPATSIDDGVMELVNWYKQYLKVK